MLGKITTIAAAGAILVSSVVPGLAQRKPAKCSSILAICMQRSGGQTTICEGMYSRAIASGQWEATQEPNGTPHPAVNCTK